MRPTFSILFFTVMSGAGYGLLFLAGTAIAVDPRRLDPIAMLLALGLGVALTVAGLISSLRHLGQPQRAWRAFSQWRSSWLSREGVAAVLCFAPALVLYTLVWRNALAMAMGALDAQTIVAMRISGGALAACALLTVFCTARIYSSLKTLRAWHNAYVLPGYLLLGLLGGASALWPIGAITEDPNASLLPAPIAMLAIGCALLKGAYWRYIDSAPQTPTIESATGLGSFGAVRAAEAPHTEENYLTHEMGFVLARKHSARLRTITLLLVGAVPAVLGACAAMRLLPAVACAAIVVPAVIAGSFVERWLFFAQARHVVMLYYGPGPARR